jgi:hypothetical protein
MVTLMSLFQLLGTLQLQAHFNLLPSKERPVAVAL